MLVSSEGTSVRSSALSTLFFTIFLDLLGFGVSMPVLAVLLFTPSLQLLPADATDAVRQITYGLLIASYPLAQFFGAPVLGALSDRFGRKRPLFLCLIGTVFGYVLSAIGVMTGDLWLLFVGRTLDGFTGGNLSIALSAIADVSDEHSKARNFGLLGMAVGLGFILGPFVGGKLSDPSILPWFSLATPFWFAAFLLTVNALMVAFFLPETLKVRVHKRLSFLTGLRHIERAFLLPNVRSMFAVIFLLALGFNFFTQFFQVYLIEKFSYDQGQIGNTFAYVGLWIAGAQGLVVRPISRRFLPGQVLMIAILLLGLTLPILILPSNHLFLYFILPFVAIFQGLIQPNSTAVISNLTDAQSQGEILGINQSFQSLAMAIPPIIAGMVATVHLDLPIILASVLTLAAWLTFTLTFRPAHPA